MTEPFQIAVVSCGPERAGEVHQLSAGAFRGHETLDPPSGAGSETVETVPADLAAGGGGALSQIGDRTAGCLRWTIAEPRDLYMRGSLPHELGLVGWEDAVQ
jgi:hypothetical protein